MKQDNRIKCPYHQCSDWSNRIRCYTQHYELCELYPQEMKENQEFDNRFKLNGQTLEDNLNQEHL